MLRRGMWILVLMFSNVVIGAQDAVPMNDDDDTTPNRPCSAKGIYRDVIAAVERHIEETFPDRIVGSEADLIMAIRHGIETCPQFLEVVERRDEAACREMIAQPHLYVEVAGLLGLQRLRAEAVRESAAVIFLKGNHDPLGLSGMAIADVAMNVIGTREFMDALANQLRTRRFEDVGEAAIGEAILGGQLTPGIVEEWYNDPERLRLPISIEAYLWMLARDVRQGAAAALPARMREDFDGFALVPGFPQVVFAKYADDDDPRLEAAMKAALEYDAGLPHQREGATMISLLVKRRALIRERIALDELNIPASRRDLLQQQ